jgi:hypothetical protein
LSEKQFGFTPQTSTIDAISSAVQFIQKSFDKKGYALLIALDIVGAFDNAWWPMILESLRKKNCPKNLFFLMKSYFDNRFAKLWHQNTEVTKGLTRGCPQGSACGPGFWNIIYDSCLKINFEENIELQCFADDSLLMVFDMSINNLKCKSELALEKLSEWAKQNKLEFNPIKTTAVIFTRNIKLTNLLLNFKIMN